ncbi:MAG TPA: hypothetical protein DDY14_16950 [Chromatiaceae bacterium]|jgi:hypothetical protein|nr:MAG: hypothetical protein N838_35640 [Thiohalocapsa sp. PB-PSB1]HBG96969.1 hypothetical protein [Chromatiaceae bacterium]HCS89716.1 hypothetical protein [Chromatiaceae bacterium]
MFNRLTMLFHRLLELYDFSYSPVRQFLPRKTFFDDLRALTRYFYFDCWDHLLAFMIPGLELDAPDTSWFACLLSGLSQQLDAPRPAVFPRHGGHAHLCSSSMLRTWYLA